jgi:hypothetical protein
VSIGSYLIGHSIPYFLALWQEIKCFIALPIQCAVGTKQREPRSGCSGEDVLCVTLYPLPGISLFLQHHMLEMFEHCQNGVQIIPWIAHFKDAGQRIVRGIWALHQLEKDETPTIGDHTIDWLHRVGAGKHICQQLREPHLDRGRRPFRFDEQDPQLIVQHQDVDLALNGQLFIGN